MDIRGDDSFFPLFFVERRHASRHRLPLAETHLTAPHATTATHIVTPDLAQLNSRHPNPNRNRRQFYVSIRDRLKLKTVQTTHKNRIAFSPANRRRNVEVLRKTGASETLESYRYWGECAFAHRILAGVGATEPGWNWIGDAPRRALLGTRDSGSHRSLRRGSASNQPASRTPVSAPPNRPISRRPRRPRFRPRPGRISRYRNSPKPLPSRASRASRRDGRQWLPKVWWKPSISA